MNSSIHTLVPYLVFLFMIQRFGIQKIGYSFSPILFTWFVLIACIGLYNITHFDPTILRAIIHGLSLIISEGTRKQLGWLLAALYSALHVSLANSILIHHNLAIFCEFILFSNELNHEPKHYLRTLATLLFSPCKSALVVCFTQLLFCNTSDKLLCL